MKGRAVKEIISILMESVFYLELPLPERLRLVKYLLNVRC